MALYQKESLENLKRKIDLVDLLSSHIDLKRTGAAYKALCPFHDEKTPSFTIQKGDTHYHCFGCGAHGDAIQFLMSHQKLSFSESVESLAHRFQVHLERVEQGEEQKGPSKKILQEALQHAADIYHYLLLHTHEGHEAAKYLFDRGVDLDFIRRFQLGLAPKGGHFLHRCLSKTYNEEILSAAGLLSANKRDFFHDRITIPIHNAMGAVIGFSARKYKEDTFGGKYVNTSETSLFKKSRILFGLHHCRRRIAKERRAIIVEGQLDTLRLISEGFNITVAGQGTAFGDEHVQELVKLGVNTVFLALDADNAGKEAVIKIGNLFQKQGVEARVLELPIGEDPDSFLKRAGAEAFIELMQSAPDYLTFAVKEFSKKIDSKSPAGKRELVQMFVTQIRSWNDEIMVHESLKKAANLLQVPEEMLGVGKISLPNLFIQRNASVGIQEIDPDKIMECDCLLWLLRFSHELPQLKAIAEQNLAEEMFKVPLCRKLYAYCLQQISPDKKVDLMDLLIFLEDPAAQEFLDALFAKKVNKDKAEALLIEAIQKLLERNFMQKREEIRMQIQSGQHSDEDAMALLRAFKEQSAPKVVVPA